MDKMKTVKDKLCEDIEILKTICQELEENSEDMEWDLCNFHRVELNRITGLEDHDWDDCNLAHFIDGMQRTLKLL